MNVPIEAAFDAACQQIGRLMVELALLRDELERVAAERDEAGRRIVELTADPEH